MKILIVLFFCVLAALIVASFARTTLSFERAVYSAKVLTFEDQPDNAVRELPLPGEISALLSDGRTVRVRLDAAETIRPGATVRVSERVAPWGETWYRLAQ